MNHILYAPAHSPNIHKINITDVLLPLLSMPDRTPRPLYIITVMTEMLEILILPPEVLFKVFLSVANL